MIWGTRPRNVTRGAGPAILQIYIFLPRHIRKGMLITEMESRTQGSRPRPKTQKKSKVKDSLSEDRHSRGQGQECSRPWTKDTSASALQKKKGLHKHFSGDLKKKVFTKIFQAISTKKRFPKNFSCALEPRTGQFSRP